MLLETYRHLSHTSKLHFLVSTILSMLHDVNDLLVLTFGNCVLKAEWLSGLFLRFFQNPQTWLFTFLARYIMMPVRLFVRLSVCLWRKCIGAIANLGFKFRSHFTAHWPPCCCGRRAACGLAGESSRAMLASARVSCLSCCTRFIKHWLQCVTAPPHSEHRWTKRCTDCRC